MRVTRILVIQLRKLGDTLMSTPLIRQLARLHPDARIDVLCEPGNACILQHNRHVTTIHTLPRDAGAARFLRLAARLRSKRYDLVVDAQSLPKTALLAWVSGAPRRLGFDKRWRRRLYTHPYMPPDVEYAATHKLRLLQDDCVDVNDVALDFPVDTRTSSEAEAFCRRWFRPPVAAICGVSQTGSRIWPAAKFATVADRLAARGFQPYIIYGPGEESDARAIAEQMRHPALIDYPLLSFPVLKETIRACSLMVAVNGGPMHLATAAGTPCVKLFEVDWMASIWNPPQRPDMRFVATRPHTSWPPLEGTFTQAETLAEIEVDAVWRETERLITRGLNCEPHRTA
jgi:ADP-heptose:LPS heptosyltransferase